MMKLVWQLPCFNGPTHKCVLLFSFLINLFHKDVTSQGYIFVLWVRMWDFPHWFLVCFIDAGGGRHRAVSERWLIAALSLGEKKIFSCGRNWAFSQPEGKRCCSAVWCSRRYSHMSLAKAGCMGARCCVSVCQCPLQFKQKTLWSSVKVWLSVHLSVNRLSMGETCPMFTRWWGVRLSRAGLTSASMTSPQQPCEVAAPLSFLLMCVCAHSPKSTLTLGCFASFTSDPALQKQADERNVPRRFWNPPCWHVEVRPQPDGEYVLQGSHQGAGVHRHPGLGGEPACACCYHQGNVRKVRHGEMFQIPIVPLTLNLFVPSECKCSNKVQLRESCMILQNHSFE